MFSKNHLRDWLWLSFCLLVILAILVFSTLKVLANTDTYNIFTTQAKSEIAVKENTSGNPKNRLIFADYSIDTPLIYSDLSDFFETDQYDNLNLDQPKNTDISTSSLQQKMHNGAVQLAFSVLPGEVGNSYIIGHSFDPSPKEDYFGDTVFENLVDNGRIGDIFSIYDISGHRLDFKVFEAISILAINTKEAYKDYGNRRVVTLQTCTEDYKIRWIVRGELIND